MYEEDDGGQYAAMQEAAARDEYNAECDARGLAEAEYQAASEEAAQAEAEQAQTSDNRAMPVSPKPCSDCRRPGDGWVCRQHSPESCINYKPRTASA